MVHITEDHIYTISDNVTAIGNMFSEERNEYNFVSI